MKKNLTILSLKSILLIGLFFITTSLIFISQKEITKTTSLKLSEIIWKTWGDWNPSINTKSYNKQKAEVKLEFQKKILSLQFKANSKIKFLDSKNNSKKESIIPKTEHSYISPPCINSEVTISMEKSAGRAKTEIEIYVHTKNGKAHKEVKYKFPNEKILIKKHWKIKGIKGKVISVNMKNNSTLKKFKYKISIK